MFCHSAVRCAASFMLLYVNEYHMAQAVYTFHGDSKLWLDNITKAQVCQQFFTDIALSLSCAAAAVFVRCFLECFAWAPGKIRTFTVLRLKANVRLVTRSALLVAWRSGNALCRINEVALRRARLVLGWVTVYGQVKHLGPKPAS